jgi:hypothetical protein
MSTWRPEPSPRVAAAMGKLTEECGELIAILGRCAAQGVDGIDPDTGKPNRRALEEEIADAMALQWCVMTILALDSQFIKRRYSEKIKIKSQWLNEVPR